MKKEITIFTDGACSGNPGKGGWGYCSSLPKYAVCILAAYG